MTVRLDCDCDGFNWALAMLFATSTDRMRFLWTLTSAHWDYRPSKAAIKVDSSSLVVAASTHPSSAINPPFYVPQGFAAYFYKQYEEERGHAHKVMTHQTERGGRVALAALTSPPAEGNSVALPHTPRS